MGLPAEIGTLGVRHGRKKHTGTEREVTNEPCGRIQINIYGLI